MDSAVLALRIDAPLQSWGVRSRFTYRDTSSEPTKSGVVGLLGSARGVERTDTARIGELARLRMAVRVEREGILERDYQVTGNVPTTKGTGHRNVVSHRFYLADALFLVLLEGDRTLIEELREDVLHPRWPLFFGRKAHVPSSPLIMPEELGWGTGVFHGQSIEEVLSQHPWQEDRQELRASAEENTRLRTVIEVPAGEDGAEARYDVPVTFETGHREFRQRYVRVDHLRIPWEREKKVES
ncbi:type I-E CRISPR-associated protein Cas5/CasD [Nocardiopsis aegyptia]|uniref:CRISPR system Cascade subunit CasD n=1 Tax=Nocardiopsis aegyptia TaxID=220378 RepID=A0A7Z0J8V1_9ACTN|nr:type I-E CRISPR-associated protein Cas5/CasD [Nocardiopsis aegyptia]NYJ32809.1 CRISPR system Cascade subunit CasD [Nocardiopsis aegyptia]